MESEIRNTIDEINQTGEKALTVFLTSGFPDPDSGADIIEIGIPFGDSLADGPVIQLSYSESLKNKTDIETTFKYVSQIKNHSKSPIVLMSSANPIQHYGKKEFSLAAVQSGVDGVIIPDVPLEEYEDFFEDLFEGLDTILLTTPTSDERVNQVDLCIV